MKFCNSGIDNLNKLPSAGLPIIISLVPSERKKGPWIAIIVPTKKRMNFQTILWYLLFNKRYKQIKGAATKTLILQATDNPSVIADIKKRWTPAKSLGFYHPFFLKFATQDGIKLEKGCFPR